MPHRLLVVIDDSPAMLALARAMVGPAGFQTLDAPDAETGFELVAAHRPAAVLLDLGLPDTEQGLELLRRLRRDDQTRDTPVVVLTQYGEPTDYPVLFAAVTIGVEGFLVKPTTPEALCEALERACRLRSAAWRSDDPTGQARELLAGLVQDLRAVYELARQARDADPGAQQALYLEEGAIKAMTAWVQAECAVEVLARP